MPALSPLFGPYCPPRCRVGGTLFCELRGTVRVYGLSAAPVPWPFTRGRGRGRPSPILCGDLARAVKLEANDVVCALFGVTPQTVSKWRKGLGVPQANPGTHERKAAPKRGVPRPPHVRAAIARARTGRAATAATRPKLSADRKARGVRPPKAGRPWTAREDRLLLTLAPAAVAARTGRTLSAVYSRRDLLRLPDGRAGRPR